LRACLPRARALLLLLLLLLLLWSVLTFRLRVLGLVQSVALVLARRAESQL
jgi:hypothetical protein